MIIVAIICLFFLRLLPSFAFGFTMFHPFLSESRGFKCLEEGMAIRASDIDVCCVFGALDPGDSCGRRVTSLLCFLYREFPRNVRLFVFLIPNFKVRCLFNCFYAKNLVELMVTKWRQNTCFGRTISFDT